MGKKTLILGLGNDLRGNDGVGLQVADYIRSNFPLPNDAITVEKFMVSGLSLISSFVQYERVFIVDSVQVDQPDVGTYWKVPSHELSRRKFPLRITHGLGISSVIDLCKKMGFSNPQEVVLFLIGIEKMSDVIYQCSDQIDDYLKDLLPTISEEIIYNATDITNEPITERGHVWQT